MSPFCLPTGGGFQITLIEVEDSAKALTKSGAAPGSDFWMFLVCFLSKIVECNLDFFQSGWEGCKEKKEEKKA